MFSSVKFLFVTCVLLFLALLVEAQSLSDIQNIKVDLLSDAQIAQLIQKAETQGISKSQIPNLARERGMSAMEARKLAIRISRLRSSAGTGSNDQYLRSGTLREMPPSSDVELSLEEIEESDSLAKVRDKIFGYRVFQNKKLDFSPSLNIPTPENYIVGAGDQLLVDVYGDSQQSYDLTVSPDGTVYVPDVGPISVGGSSIGAVTSRVRRELGNIYADLISSSPRTFMQVRLGNIRSIQVAMVGELSKPGNYTLPSFASVFNALYAAGGPNEQGTFRNIKVYRNSRMVAEVDVYDFLLNGNQGQNIRLQDNDVISVPAVQTRVEVQGPVRREGYFEIQPDEDINDLIRYAGGFKSEAYTQQITVRRYSDEARKVADVSREEFETFKVQGGDVFMVGKKLDRFENRVQISGAVYYPGEFKLFEGMTVRDLIKKGGGLRGEAFLNRATLFRTTEDVTLDVVSVDVEGIVDGSVQDIPLQREDVLHIPSKYDLKEEYYVKISGEVNRSGVFAFAENMTVEDLVLMAGGLKESASNAYIEVGRRVRDRTDGQIADIFTVDIDKNLEVDPEDKAMVLAPFDHVIVRKSPGFQKERLVNVEGEVFYPGQYALSKATERISDLLKRAGGLNQFAYVKGAKLIRRTEYYEPTDESKIRDERLKTIRQNLLKEEGRNTEAENNILSRIDEKLMKSEKEESDTSHKEGLIATAFQAGRLQEASLALASDSVEMKKVELEEEEMVGIDLAYIIRHPGSDQDLILQEGDVLSIPKQLQTVRMRGEVLFPASARYVDDMSFKEYISKAGGYTDDARKSKTYVIYPNGDVAQTKKFIFFNDYPRIEPGAEIVVPRRPKRDRVPVAVWITLATGLASLAVSIQQLTR